MHTVYALQSTREHGGYIARYDRTPKLFASRTAAWWFKARRGKWHWKVVPDHELEISPIVELQDIS